MSDFVRFFTVLFFGCSIAFIIAFLRLFANPLDPLKRSLIMNDMQSILIPTFLIAFYVSHMFDHITSFLDFIVNQLEGVG